MNGPRRLVETRPTGHTRARGLVSNRVSGQRIEARTFAPPEDLVDVVAAFWQGRWALRGQPAHESRLLPDPCMHIVFERSDQTTGSRVVGVWTHLWTRTLSGQGMVRGVKLRAGACSAILPLPAKQFANCILPLSSLFPAPIEALERAVLGASDEAEAFGALEAWLRSQRRADEDTTSRTLAVALVERIAKDSDITTVERLGDVAGLGVRALQRLFWMQVGATPKRVIRIHRLQEVALRIQRGDVSSLATLAAELGYTDQAHLARDFKSVVGKSPRAFAEE